MGAPRETLTSSRKRLVRFIVVAALLAGLGVRAALIVISPRHGYFADHDDFVRWGIQAVDEGILSLYVHAPPPRPAVFVGADGRRSLRTRYFERILNYPPLVPYGLWLEGIAHQRLDPQRYANTVLARGVYSALSILGDLLTAWGCFSIVRALATPLEAAVTFAVVFLLPPLFIDSTLWGQKDSWVLAAAVWMVEAMGRERWWRGGFLWGLA
ncbi:MAG: hypothetical protein ACREQQ_09280, partial [Candidatus Binatia bacterium]